jgi:hypothetical protein
VAWTLLPGVFLGVVAGTLPAGVLRVVDVDDPSSF